MPFSRVALSATTLALCMALLAALVPAATMAAADEKREYIVTLDVTGAGRVIEPSGREARGKIKARAERARQVTERLGKEHRVKPRHRFGHAVTGFSARMTAAQASALARDAKVASVRPVRTVSLASQTTPPGIERVKAIISGGPAADVDADVAVVDTGIGPAGNELNVVGGVNATDTVDCDGPGGGDWTDSQGHGTHVAGIIGARDNSVGTVGVAPGVRLWSVRVFNGFSGTDATVMCGLDWVVAQNSDADPDNDIDVINMSIEAPRIDQQEDCGAVLADPDGDLIQKGVCQAVALGITVVAAAGNQSGDANYSAPGGYDQVISVGAITDTDGSGGGKGGNASCGGYASLRDDAYARAYSNYGREVDIVAPGTCIRSTAPGSGGGATAVLSGTSMAAPHVTGAVARYIAKRGPTDPGTMRRLVRAAGRMDWDPKSDPLWSGTDDPDPPNRILDVGALVGPPMLRTWLYHDTFKISRKDRSRTTRVDIQRGGGHTAAITLGRTGLPRGVGATFDDGTLEGLGATSLGTNMHLRFKLDGAQGRFDVGVTSRGAGIASPARNLRLIVDRTGPKVTKLGPKLRKLRLAKNGSVAAYLQWRVHDTLSGVRQAQLQRKVGSAGKYRDLRPGGLRSTKVTLKRGQANRFRVKATDTLGNVRWSPSVGAKLKVRDSTSAMWQEPTSGDWKTKKASSAYGGSFLLARGATSSLTTRFYGIAAAIAAPVGPSRGSFRVRVDGGSWQRVSLQSKASAHRKVVWSMRLGKGRHTLEIRGASGQSAIDALLFVR